PISKCFSHRFVKFQTASARASFADARHWLGEPSDRASLRCGSIDTVLRWSPPLPLRSRPLKEQLEQLEVSIDEPVYPYCHVPYCHFAFCRVRRRRVEGRGRG